jgi:uncharacterized membrane protein YfcA
MEIIKLVATFFVGLLVSLIGSIVGSAGLINIPFLIFMGLPPHIAIATHRVGAVGLQIGALVRFLKSKEIDWRYVTFFSVLALLAAPLGANLLIQTDPELLKHIIVGVMLLVVLLMFFNKDIGLQNREVPARRKIMGYLLYFLVLIWQAFFGGGTATMYFFVMMYFFGMSINRANATVKIPGLFLGLVTLIIFINNDMINWAYGLAMFFGMLIGGYIGIHIALKKGNAWVKTLFIIFVLGFAVKLLLE